MKEIHLPATASKGRPRRGSPTKKRSLMSELPIQRSLRLRKTDPSSSEMVSGSHLTVPKMYAEINFRRDLATTSIISRLEGLKSVVGYKIGSLNGNLGRSQLSPANQRLLLGLDKRLRVFGYSLISHSEHMGDQWINGASAFVRGNKLLLSFFPFMSVDYRKRNSGGIFV